MADTPRDQLDVLVRELAALRPGFDVLENYYAGRPPLAKEPSRLTDNYRELLEMSTSNWCRLVVDVVVERLVVESIRSTKNQTNDSVAWSWWQANNLDAYSSNVMRESLKGGVSYVGVWPGATGRPPAIVGQVPTQVHVRYLDDEPGVALDAVKMWVGRDRRLHARTYTNGRTWKWRTKAELAAPKPSEVFSNVPHHNEIGAYDWEEDGSDTNPMGVVPFVQFPCHPDLTGGWTSEIEPIMNIQRRINKTTFDRMLAQEFTAFPQRWATGMDIPVGDDGKPLETLDAAIDRVWTATSPDTTFGQFAPGQVAPYLSAEQSDVQALATQSRTPPHYLTGGMGSFPSGESVRATEYGLARKVGSHQLIYGERWSDVIRLAAVAAKNDELAKDPGIDVNWADVSARTEGEMVDALLKMSTLGVPRKVLWERWGATPQEIERWESEYIAEQKRLAEAGIPEPIGTGGSQSGTDPTGAPKAGGGNSNDPKPRNPPQNPAQARASAF